MLPNKEIYVTGFDLEHKVERAAIEEVLSTSLSKMQ
jgi:hypothetical protein